MKKIGFVTPWYGENIPGGAEALLRGLVKNLHKSGLQLEVLTTNVRQFTDDWNVDYYKSGLYNINGIPVRHFPVRKRNAAAFDEVNTKLMRGLRLTQNEESIFIEEMVNSPDLYNWMNLNSDDFSLFVFIPYMFGTTYHGIKVNPSKSVMIPCFHDEAYAYLNIFKNLFPQVRGMVFNAHPEMVLAEKIYNLSAVEKANLGAGVDTDIKANPQDFIDKFGISEPFILYAGRKDEGKNIGLLLKYFKQYKAENDIKLVLIGGGSIKIPKSIENDVIDLGFVSYEDKFNAYAAATLLCQPSVNESFSIVIMESWMCGRPVLVHADCPVTKNFVTESNAGLYFRSYHEFAGCVNYFLNNKEVAAQMGLLGRKYVRENFAWEIIVEKYTNFFKKLCGEV